MKEESEIINDEELKKIFLNEAMLLCPSAWGGMFWKVRNYKSCTIRCKRS